MSILLKKPTPRDRYVKASSLTPIDTSSDISHVQETFPRLRLRPLLMRKLGTADTRRRERLRYQRKHHEKLSNVPATEAATSLELPDPAGHKTTEEHETGTKASHDVDLVAELRRSQSQLAKTKAPTSVANDADDSLFEAETDESDTSSVTSIGMSSIPNETRIPAAPKESAGGIPFECPYYFTIQTLKHPKHWR